MSDELEWTETGDRWTEAVTNSVSLGTALYESECTGCGDGLGWRLVADPDSPVWEAKCCEKLYSMHVDMVSMTRSDANL